MLIIYRYLKNHLSVAHPDQAELESMRSELNFAHRQIETLKYARLTCFSFDED